MANKSRSYTYKIRLYELTASPARRCAMYKSDHFKHYSNITSQWGIFNNNNHLSTVGKRTQHIRGEHYYKASEPHCHLSYIQYYMNIYRPIYIHRYIAKWGQRINVKGITTLESTTQAPLSFTVAASYHPI